VRNPDRLPETLLGFVRTTGVWHQAALSLLSVAVFAASTAPLEIQRRLIDGAVAGSSVEMIVLLAVAYAGLALAEGLLKLGLNVYRAWISETAVRELREHFRRLLDGLPAGPEGATSRGVGASAILMEAEPIGGFVGGCISEPVLQGGLLASVFGYMLYLQPTMALVAFVALSPQLLFLPLLQRAINARIAARIETLRSVGGAIADGPTEDSDATRTQDARIARTFALNMRIYELKFSMNFLMNLLHHAGTACVLAVGGWLVVAGDAQIGTVVAFIAGLAKVNDPWGDLVDWYRELTATATKYRLAVAAASTLDAAAGR
jgi:ABC-type bacteriocin/lantibiotic exporter with double-glycine peptidase domain